jgi:rhodanese-related sulfurtransferase
VAILIVKIAGKYLLHKVGNISKPVLLTFSVAQSAGLVFIALFAGVIYHFANDEGFLAHAGATESVVKTNLASFIPKVSAKDIKSANGGAVIIDARQSPDYDAGHIDGAINIPTTLCAAGRTAKLAEVAKNSRLIIYCQSAGCPYAEKVAANLMEDGFNNLAIYKGGWVDWDKRKK